MNSQDKGSLRLYATGMFIAAMLLCASTNFAQERSKDRDNPTLLTSNELSDDLDGSNDEYFYKFSAGPGKLTITFDVTASGTNAGAHLDLFDTSARSILTDVLAQGVDSGSERVVKTVQLGRLRDIVMRIKGIKYGDSGGNGVYKVRLDGAVNFKPADTPKTTSSPTPSPEPSSPVASVMSSPPSSFAGCWNFTGKGSFAFSLGCFKQEGAHVTFENSEFEGTVIGNTLRFTNKTGKTALAYLSGHFVMDAGGKSFTGAVNSTNSPDENEFPVTATLGTPKVNKQPQ